VDRCPGFFWWWAGVFTASHYVLRLCFRFCPCGQIPLRDLRLLDLEERVRSHSKLLQISLLYQPKELPGKELQAVHREVEFLEFGESANSRWNFGEFIIAQTEHAQRVELEELACQA
jgi:hypothetical protein